MPKQEYPRWLKVLIILMLIPIGWFTYVALAGDMELTYAVTDEGIQIQHGGALVVIPPENRTIPFSEIIEVQLLDRIPKMHKSFGKDGFRTWVGDFKSDAYGPVKAYILNTSWPAVVVRTESNIFVLTPRNAADFVQQVQARLMES